MADDRLLYSFLPGRVGHAPSPACRNRYLSNELLKGVSLAREEKPQTGVIQVDENENDDLPVDVETKLELDPRPKQSAASLRCAA